jgi:putative Mg2+ transporter-C (MgtC) family protein
MGIGSLLYKIVLSILAGGVIGIEREFKHKGAGLRTHMILCIGSMLTVLTSIYLFDIYRDSRLVDPTRIIAGLITGIGVLCAGTIMRGGSSVVGLTTAVTLWVVAGIGVAIGCSFYIPAILVAIVVCLVLVVGKKVENLIIHPENNNKEKE